MAKALDEILQKYFGCSVPFRKDGELTATGEKAMRKLEELLSDLEGIGVIPSASTAVRQLDEIVKGEKPEEDGEPVSSEPKTFDEVYDELQYICIENTPEKTAEVVAEEIRGKIRAMGWDCLDEFDTEEEWRQEHCPELESLECYCVSENDFLCDNDGFCERMPGGHDVDWQTFKVEFYGVWKEKGVFNVYID